MNQNINIMINYIIIFILIIHHIIINNNSMMCINDIIINIININIIDFIISINYMLYCKLYYYYHY